MPLESFGTTEQGEAVTLYTLTNGRGTEIRIMDYGATIVSLRMHDREGRCDDIVLGFDSLDKYRTHAWYCGATIGRYAGRIRNARFALRGRDFRLAANAGQNHLHGGFNGFDKVLWHGELFQEAAMSGLTLRYLSPDGEEGYPGTLDTRVTYMLTDDDDLIVDYHATTDQATPVNLTQHSYFNLAGASASAISAITDHALQINADFFLPIDGSLIPTGELRSVDNTAFDFTQARPIGVALDATNEQLRLGNGYDHDFLLRRDEAGDAAPTWAARVFEPGTGRILDVLTTEPALHFYSGNFLDGSVTGKNGVRYGPRCGFALEAQHIPDSPNQPAFPSAILQPGAPYRARTVYRFSVAG